MKEIDKLLESIERSSRVNECGQKEEWARLRFTACAIEGIQDPIEMLMEKLGELIDEYREMRLREKT